MTYSSPGGWKERVRKTAEKQAGRDSLADVRAQRAAMYAEQAERGRIEAAENAARMQAERIVCPCCAGEGRITVELAERVYRALERLPSDSRPDLHVMATLAQIARGETVHGFGPKVSEGLSHPVPLAAETKVAPAQSFRTSGNRNKLADHDFTDDRALIEV